MAQIKDKLIESLEKEVAREETRFQAIKTNLDAEVAAQQERIDFLNYQLDAIKAYKK